MISRAFFLSGFVSSKIQDIKNIKKMYTEVAFSTPFVSRHNIWVLSKVQLSSVKYFYKHTLGLCPCTQAVVWTSTPRKYPYCKYFLGSHKVLSFS